jgi:hypothetical protein
MQFYPLCDLHHLPMRRVTLEESAKTISRKDANTVQKLPDISIEVIRMLGRECSSMKSSAKVSLLARVLSGVFS